MEILKDRDLTAVYYRVGVDEERVDIYHLAIFRGTENITHDLNGVYNEADKTITIKAVYMRQYLEVILNALNDFYKNK